MRDDIELSGSRFRFWDTTLSADKKPANWRLHASGSFGHVYHVKHVTPKIRVVVEDGELRHFKEVAVKVAKEGGEEELRTEVERLAKLSHPNVLQILGMFQDCCSTTDHDCLGPFLGMF